MSSNWTQAEETSLMMNSTKTQKQWHSPFPALHHLHAAQLLTLHLWPHLWTTRVPVYSAACSDSSSLWTMYFEQSHSNVRIPHCSCQIYTWSQHCRPHDCRLQSEPSAVAPHCTYDKAWSCKEPFSHLTMLTLTTWNFITKGQDLIQSFDRSVPQLSRRMRQMMVSLVSHLL